MDTCKSVLALDEAAVLAAGVCWASWSRGSTEMPICAVFGVDGGMGEPKVIPRKGWERRMNMSENVNRA